jgi:hypothetical protein
MTGDQRYDMRELLQAPHPLPETGYLAGMRAALEIAKEAAGRKDSTGWHVVNAIAEHIHFLPGGELK